jgi:hypothetical protein
MASLFLLRKSRFAVGQVANLPFRPCFWQVGNLPHNLPQQELLCYQADLFQAASHFTMAPFSAVPAEQAFSVGRVLFFPAAED